MLRGEGHSITSASMRISVGREQQPNRNDSDCPEDWRAPKPTIKDFFRKAVDGIKEQAALLEAFWVAVTFHVLLFPIIWFVGWALPWPKPPMITTVIELNIENWPESATPISIEELYETEMSKARKK